MSRRPVVEYPDPRLRAVARDVEAFDGALERLIGDLVDTLGASTGIGLSAPQFGEPRRVLALGAADEGAPAEVYVNPVIVSRGGIAITRESCLSLPGIAANVVRASRVRVRARDRDGVPFERVLDGLPAVCLQHEVDHLDGRLFIDRVSRPRRWLFRHRWEAAPARAAGRAAGRSAG